MIIGILSDTHGRVDAMEQGMKALRAAGAEYFLHCGDVGGPLVLDLLAGVPSAFVWGNTDDFHARREMKVYAQGLGIQCCDTFGDLTLGDKKIALMHGDDGRLKQRVLAGQRHDYLFQGHTHLREDQRIGLVRLINPGALHRASQKSVAVLDTETDELQFIAIGFALQSD